MCVSGHAILGALMNDYDVVAKISIIPRGPAGGVTIFMPSEERLNSGRCWWLLPLFWDLDPLEHDRVWTILDQSLDLVDLDIY